MSRPEIYKLPLNCLVLTLVYRPTPYVVEVKWVRPSVLTFNDVINICLEATVIFLTLTRGTDDFYVF